MSVSTPLNLSDHLQEAGFNLKGREDWKYSDSKALTETKFAPISGAKEQNLDVAAYLSQADTHKLVFLNGVYQSQLSQVSELPAGVELGSLAGLNNPKMDTAAHPVSALSQTHYQDGLRLEVAPGVKLERPVELFFLTDGQANETLVAVRNLIKAGAGSSLTVVEHFGGPSAGKVLNTPLTEILCEENATVRHLKVIREAEDNLHFGSTHVRQLAKSHFTSREFALGGASIRRELHVELDGEGAHCDLTALYMASGQQRMDMRTRVNHNVPGCTTNELYKGLLDGQAKTVFDGLIKVAKDAQQTLAFQTNRTLVLSDDTVSYSIPRLEIYADDVKCSHGSTTGQLDDDQLFFLRTRGFDRLTARIMLANAFASEILEGVRNLDLRQSLSKEIATRLGESSVGRNAS